MTFAPRLSDVAEACGVHPSTVSRALSGSPSGISPTTVKRVREVALRMGYRPNAAAAALKTGRSDVIGILVPKLTDYVLARIYEGCAHAAGEIGGVTMVMTSDDAPDKRRASIVEFTRRMVSGMVICDSRIRDDQVVRDLETRGVPFILANRRSGHARSVTHDDRLGGTLVAEHLLETGHEHVGIIGGLDYASTCIDRVDGFVDRFAAAGIDVPPASITHGPIDAETGFSQSLHLLNENPDITAIFAVNDFSAIGAMGAVRQAGRKIGEDVAVIGYNDIPMSSVLPVPLTTVRSDMFEMGRHAVQVLTGQNEAHETDVRLPPELVVRDSSSTSPG